MLGWMAFPRKGSRCLVVDEVQYRYIGLFCERDRLGGEVHEVRVQLAKDPEQVLRAEFGYARLKKEYDRVGKHVSRSIDTLPPFAVRQAIRIGLEKGWRPAERGREIDIGILDDQVDWTELRPDS